MFNSLNFRQISNFKKMKTTKKIKTRNISRIPIVLLGLILFCLPFTLNAQTIAGSDGSARCQTCAPLNWVVDTGTPDISDKDQAALAGTTGGDDFWLNSIGVVQALPLPPNGHTTWITLRDVGTLATEEVVSTTIAGLVVGDSYEIVIYSLTARTGTYSPQYIDFYSFQVDAGAINTVTAVSQNSWGTNKLRFIATATTANLQLRPGANMGSLEADLESVNLSVTVNNVVLVPGAKADDYETPPGFTLDGNIFINNGNGADTNGTGTTSIDSYDNLTTDGGAVVITADGNFTYTPVSLSYTGIDTFTYTLIDSNGAISTATVTINASATGCPPGQTSASTTTIVYGASVSEETAITSSANILGARDNALATVGKKGILGVNMGIVIAGSPSLSVKAGGPAASGGALKVEHSLDNITYTLLGPQDLEVAFSIASDWQYIRFSKTNNGGTDISIDHIEASSASGSSCVPDRDGDGVPDSDDLDDDNDGISDIIENGGNPTLDTDGDGLIDQFDTDSDNDGCPDALEGDGTITESQLTTLFEGSNGGSSDNLGKDADAEGNPKLNPGDATGFEQNSTAAALNASNTAACAIIDLNLVKTIDKAVRKKGETIIFTIQITNSASLTATGVLVKDLLPSGLLYNAAASTIPANTTYNSGTGIWDLTAISITTNQTIELKIAATINTIGAIIINQSEVISSNETDVDSTPNNNN